MAIFLVPCLNTVARGGRGLGRTDGSRKHPLGASNTDSHHLGGGGVGGESRWTYSRFIDGIAIDAKVSFESSAHFVAWEPLLL